MGAADRPQIGLMTALPLVWGEGGPSDILAGRSARSATLGILDKHFDVRPIDTLSAATLGSAPAIIAQPRRLTPNELVALDKWVRRGGRAMIFADPELLWPSSYAPGDNRRAPPVTLLDPLFAHWGVSLGDSDGLATTVSDGGRTVAMLAAGRWTGSRRCRAIDPKMIDCRIEAGRVLLIGDADMLDARFWQSRGGDNAEWIAAQLKSLDGQPESEPGQVSSTTRAMMGIVLGLWIWSGYYALRRT